MHYSFPFQKIFMRIFSLNKRRFLRETTQTDVVCFLSHLIPELGRTLMLSDSCFRWLWNFFFMVLGPCVFLRNLCGVILWIVGRNIHHHWFCQPFCPGREYQKTSKSAKILIYFPLLLALPVIVNFTNEEWSRCRHDEDLIRSKTKEAT